MWEISLVGKVSCKGGICLVLVFLEKEQDVYFGAEYVVSFDLMGQVEVVIGYEYVLNCLKYYLK